MDQENFLKMVGFLFVGFFIISYIVKMFHIQTGLIEGLTGGSDSLTNTDKTIPSSGEAGLSTSYAAAVKAQVVKIQDELLVSKYRKDYESVIINLDDYIGYLMLKQSLNLNLDGDIKSNIEKINNLTILKNAKDSLNSTMIFLDKQ